MSITSTINSITTRDFHHKFIDEMFDKHKWFQATYNTDKGRTGKQNSSLHVYLEMLANALNDSGQPLIIVINGVQTEVDWSMERCKDFMWRPLQLAITKHKSSTRISTKECMSIYEHLNRHTASKLGIGIDWPHKDDQ